MAASMLAGTAELPAGKLAVLVLATQHLHPVAAHHARVGPR